ncbi:hypothetical protein [Bradyrhizobium sp.]
MRSLIQLFSNGGAVANIWQRAPLLIKAPVVVGLVLLAGAELTRDVNQALRSGRVTEGEAVKADAQAADPNKTRADVAAGKPVSGAERTIAAQVAGLDADAQQKQAVADAATESEDELLEKARRGLKLSSTEKLRLRELQLKEKELAIKEQELTARGAEAHIKTAEATAADSKAAVENTTNRLILRSLGGNLDPGQLAFEMMRATAPRNLQTPGARKRWNNPLLNHLR